MGRRRLARLGLRRTCRHPRLIACVILLFTGRYPPTLFNFALGLDRWSFRVAAYVGLMTDTYTALPARHGAIRADYGRADTLEGDRRRLIAVLQAASWRA